MSQVRPRTRKVRVDRVREVQGVLAMQGLLSEDERAAATVATKAGGTEPRGGRRLADVKPLPYRKVLANWPDESARALGAMANDLEDSGLSWRDAEGRAFVEIYSQVRAATDVERNYVRRPSVGHLVSGTRGVKASNSETGAPSSRMATGRFSGVYRWRVGSTRRPGRSWRRRRPGRSGGR